MKHTNRHSGDQNLTATKVEHAESTVLSACSTLVAVVNVESKRNCAVLTARALLVR